jgi:hypothetical protein
MFHIAVCHFNDECIGQLPMDEILRQPNKGPVGQVLSDR